MKTKKIRWALVIIAIAVLGFMIVRQIYRGVRDVKGLHPGIYAPYKSVIDLDTNMYSTYFSFANRYPIQCLQNSKLSMVIYQVKTDLEVSIQDQPLLEKPNSLDVLEFSSQGVSGNKLFSTKEPKASDKYKLYFQSPGSNIIYSNTDSIMLIGCKEIVLKKNDVFDISFRFKEASDKDTFRLYIKQESGNTYLCYTWYKQ